MRLDRLISYIILFEIYLDLKEERLNSLEEQLESIFERIERVLDKYGEDSDVFERVFKEYNEFSTKFSVERKKYLRIEKYYKENILNEIEECLLDLIERVGGEV